MEKLGTWKDVTDSLHRITPFGRVVIAICLAIELFAAVIYLPDHIR